MKTIVYNQKGEKMGEIELSESIFGVKLNTNLLHQVVISQMSNRRQSNAHTKDRGAVRGGGRKPWRQKGTGRARHGSIRSPIWIGGGVTFGPTNEKNYKKIIPKKIKRKALFMVLTEKVKSNTLIIVNDINLSGVKTKEMFQIINTLFKNLNLKKGKTFIALPEYNENIIKSARNITDLKTIQSKDLNALDLLNTKYLIMPQKSIDSVVSTFID
jgi:large subunit ribosomal protein L4